MSADFISDKSSTADNTTADISVIAVYIKETPLNANDTATLCRRTA